MGSYVTQQWTPTVTDGVPRRFTRSGTYRAFVPDSLLDLEIPLTRDLETLLDEAEARAREAAALAGPAGLGQIGDLLVRSEAAASSLIEGYEPTPRAVAVADFVARGRESAVTVARTLHAVRASVERAQDPAVSLVWDVVELQRLITPRHAGVRREPVWIGGRTPLEAHYNAPPHELVPDLLDDLDAYLASRRHSPVLAAALAHVQLETIHPFADGNGRAGRVLIGTVLARYGVSRGVTLPVSTALFRDRERYYAALDAYRRGDRGVAIATVIAEAVIAAAADTLRLSSQVSDWQHRQTAALDDHLRDRSPSGRVRRGVAHRLIADLPTHPVLDAASVAARFEVTGPAARNALEALAAAGVLRADKKADRTRTVYVATELLDLVAEPGATSDVDPASVVDVPVTASDPETETACGAWLPAPDARATCREVTAASTAEPLPASPRRAVGDDVSVEYVSREPGPPLDGLIDDLYYLDGAPPYSRLTLPAAPAPLLIVNLGAPFLIRSGTDREAVEYTDGCVVTTPTRAWEFSYPTPTRSVGVHFKPWGPAPFLPMPAAELCDRPATVAQIWGQVATAELRARLTTADTPHEMLNLLDDELTSRLREIDGLDLVRHMSSAIAATGGAVPISDLGVTSRASSTYVARRFKAIVGVTPKRLARSYRFTFAVLAIDVAAPIDWADVAARAGYFDQAHFVHEFREFTGLTPTRYVEVRRRFLRDHPDHALEGWPLPAE